MSEEFFDKYALKVSQVHLFSIYTYICVLDFEATCDREMGKVEQEVLAIPIVLLDAGYGHMDNSFRVPDSMCDL